jgi:hypothetical protein
MLQCFKNYKLNKNKKDQSIPNPITEETDEAIEKYFEDINKEIESFNQEHLDDGDD